MIHLIEGEAMPVLRNVDGVFDVVFVDADKPNYVGYYETVLERDLLAVDGVMVFDNTLWGGTVVHPPTTVPPTLEGVTGQEWVDRMIAAWTPHVVAFNEHVARDRRVRAVPLTVADGMTLITHAAPFEMAADGA